MLSRTGSLLLLVLLVVSSVCHPQPSALGTHLADSVKAEFLHAWNGYKKYAWGHDALKPLTMQPHNWYGVSVCMTPVDAYDTMLLMGLTNEAAETKKLILDSLSFDKNLEVQAFEIIIRLLGGLLSSYQMDGDERFLKLAQDLGDRLLPIYDSPTGMPYRFVHLQTGKVRDARNNPAEIGTALLEFGTLSKLTGNPVYYDKAKQALIQLFNRRSQIGLVGTWIDVESGKWVDTRSHISGAIDSYYEYLLKAWLLFGDRDCKTMFNESMKAVHAYLADEWRGDLWYGVADMNTGKRIATTYGALDAFFPSVLCLAGDTVRAKRLQESGYKMWNLHGLEPETIDYDSMKVRAPEYYLRPEIIESAYYLRHYTNDQRYSEMGDTFLKSIRMYCRTESGYAYLKNVVTKEKADGMESFFFAETLKYFYLLFAPEEKLSLENVVFTTEAHPIRRTWKEKRN